MEEEKYQELIQTLSFFEENNIPIDLMREQLEMDYIDSFGNNYLHYLSNYTFKEFCFYKYNPSKNEIINEEEFKSLLNKYLDIIKLFIQNLVNINCNIDSVNFEGQTPFELCLIKQNYYMANEMINYIVNYDSLFYDNKINILFFNNCIQEESITFILKLFTFFSNKENIILYLGRSIDNEGTITPLLSFFKDYNQNIYNKFIEFVKINIVKYLQKDDKDEYFIIKSDEIKNEIMKKSVTDMNNFCIVNFYNFVLSLNELGADINFAEKAEKESISSFMYIMSYPMIPDFQKFIANINYQDYFGRTPLIHLINNKKNIINISKDVYNDAFNELIGNELIDLSKRDLNGISAFLLCLINDYYEDAKKIYNKHNDKLLSDFNLDFLLLFIIKMNTNKFDQSFVQKINEKFGNEINYKEIDIINKRNILHYFFMCYSNDFDSYQKTLNFVMNLVADSNMNDIYNRNCLFYLFIDFCGDPKKKEDPYMILEYCLKNNIFHVSIDEKDIFGNSLLTYSIKGCFMESMKVLLKYGASLDNTLNKEGNDIFSTAIMANDDIFFHLYNIKRIPNILDNKIFLMSKNYDFFLNSKLENNNDGIGTNTKLSMKEFFQKPNLILNKSSGIEKKNKNKNKKKEAIEKMKSDIIPSYDENHFTLLNLLNEQQMKIINNYYNENYNFKFENPLKITTIKIDDKNIYNIIEILRYPNEFIKLIESKKKCIFSGNFDQYLIYKKKAYMIPKLKENPFKDEISKCKFYLETNDVKNFILELSKIINIDDEKKILDLKNDEGQNIFHILAMSSKIENKELESIYDKLSKFKIDNLYDSFGNTPMYYACNKLNKLFIEKYSNYIFVVKINVNINFQLFLETKNNKLPLKELYKHLHLEDNSLLSLIIELSIKEKIGDIKYITNYLIDNYKSSLSNFLLEPYNININNPQYIIRVIGLYQYFANILNDNIMVEDENGNNPIMLCVIRNKYDFLFDALLPIKRETNNIKKFDLQNKEGKTVIHLIIQSKIYNKKEMLLQMLKEGFNYNVKDNNQLLPIDYAYLNKENEIIEILKKKYEKDNLIIETKLLNSFYEDSDKLINESILDSSKYQKSDKLFALVLKDSKYNGDNIHKVCIDNECIPYNVELVKGDINNINELSIVYQMQILENTKNQNFLLVFKNENENDYSEIRFDKLNDAEVKFKELFTQKTANNWDEIKKDRTKFKVNDLNIYLNYDYSKESDIYDYLKISIDSLFITKNLIYNGNNKIRDLIYYLAIQAYNNIFKDTDEKNKENIIKNYKIEALSDAIFTLNEIENLIKAGKNYTNLEKKKINYLINSYLELIPFSIHQYDIDFLKTASNINEEKGRITSFYFIKNILKIFLGAIKNLDNLHPLDYIINSLGCNIIELEEKNIERFYITKFLKNTGANDIKNIYKITKSINDKNFNPKNFEHRFILCYETKAEDILGILSEGLKISSVQDNYGENSYGKGIYLFDSFIPPKNYSEKDRNFLLLVEASLNSIEDHDLYDSNLDSFDFYKTDDGYMIINLNKLKDNIGTIVIKDSMNVRVKYIVEI